MIDEARDVQERNRTSAHPSTATIMAYANGAFTDRPFGGDGTLTINSHEETIVPEHQRKSLSPTGHDTATDTFQSSSCNTMIELSSESSDTMIINENGTETENDTDSQQDTLKVRSREEERSPSVGHLDLQQDASGECQIAVYQFQSDA